MKTIFKLCLVLCVWALGLLQMQAATTLFSENFGTPTATTLITGYTGWQNTTATFSGTADIRNTSVSSTYTDASGNGNVWLAYNATVKYIQIAGINTSNYSDISLSFGLLKGQAAATSAMLDVQVSADGSNWTSLTISSGFPTAASNWSLVACTGTIPATSTLYLKITNNQTATYQFRIDDIKITGTGAAIPTLTTSLSEMSLTTLTGQSKSDTVTITGSDLTENVSLSLSGTDAGLFSLSSSSAASSGSTKIGVLYTPTTAGDHTATLTLTSSGLTKTVALTGTAYSTSTGWVEDFETGTKTTYTTANTQCTKGEWIFSNSLIGNTTSDKTFGLQSARIKTGGGDTCYVAMNFDKADGAAVVTVYASLYASHSNAATWTLSMSTDQGTSWTVVGSEISTTNTALAPVSFTVNQTGNVRFKIIKTNATNNNTLNVDNITITDYTGAGISENEQASSVYAATGSIVVNLSEKANIELISIQGITLQHKNGTIGENIFPVSQGLYLVKIGNQTKKVIVK